VASFVTFGETEKRVSPNAPALGDAHVLMASLAGSLRAALRWWSPRSSCSMKR
jgi:hypothetical protein